jgi:hypothetical protein
MSQDLEKLFTKHSPAFDSQDSPSGHQKRFMDKLHKQQVTVTKSTRTWIQPLSIAATIIVIIAIGSMFFNTPVQASELASVSPEMEQTQSFFTTTINLEVKKLEAIEDPELTELIADTIQEIDILEKQYNNLKEDLLESGQDSRVIAAMISNFQDRIALLEQVSKTIEEIKTLKNNKNEITL